MITKLFAAVAASINGLLQPIVNATWIEWLWLTIGGIIGWIIGEFTPAFPLLVVAFLFVLYDAWSAFELDKRVHQRYPEKTTRHQAKFVSYKFRSVIPTLIERMVIIILAYCCERWVFVHVEIPVSYIAAAVVCAEQALSIAENKSSCRLPGDKHARLWKMLASVLIDKTERHFDILMGEEAHKPIGEHRGRYGAGGEYYDNSDVVAEQPDEQDI
jgi:hypothetical protein